MTEDVAAVCKKLFLQHPLLLHSEVVEQGESCLREVERLVASGRVGCRTLKEGDADSRVYWRKTNAMQTPTSKRRRPKFVSPLVESVSKRPRLNETNLSPAALTSPVTVQSQGSSREEEEEELKLREKKKELEETLREKEERLRKLKMVKLYRNKNDLGQLDTLIEKWRQASQDIAEALLSSSSREPRPTMEQMLDYLRIDKSLIKYSTETESFY